jgi:predicted Zn-ribbon and HTH transcriptional regulator
MKKKEKRYCSKCGFELHKNEVSKCDLCQEKEGR